MSTTHTRPDPAEVLFRPLRLGGVEIANRIIQSPMAALQPRDDGTPSEQTVAFVRERARGGVGLIIVGGTVATRLGVDEAPFKPLLQFDSDHRIPDLRRIPDALHALGVPVFAQMFPAFGRMGVPAEGRPTIAASPVPVRMGAPNLPPGLFIPGGRVMPPPQEATHEQIRELQKETVKGAVRAQRAGFDGIEIGAHMCYFFSSFLSTRSNLRTDEYGGSAENRARAVTELVAMLHAELGPDYPVGLRMSVDDHTDGESQDAAGFAEVAAHIAAEGLAYIALTNGNYESMHKNLPSGSGDMLAEGAPQAFRAAVGDVPLILSNVYDPHQAAEAIEAGHADAYQLARQLLADPQYPNKVREGRIADIVWCDHSNECIRRLMLNLPNRCHLNPRTGREAELDGHPVPLARRLRRPVEATAVAASGNPALMGVLDTLASKKAAKAGAGKH